jgi:hypothetical protein
MPLEIASVVLPASYFDAPDGSVVLTVSGGTPPYLYSWDNGDSSSIIYVKAGVYVVTVTDSIGATITQSFTVGQPIDFNLDSKPYDVGLLSDFVTRDLYSRYALTEQLNLNGRSSASALFNLRQNDGSYNTIASLSAGATGLSFKMYDSLGVSHETLKVTDSDVTVNGDLVVTGATTQVYVADIRVEDKTITLCSTSTSASETDGAGIVIGNDTAIEKSLLYARANDAFSVNTSFHVYGTNPTVRVGNVWGTATILGSDKFKVENVAGSISLDSNGLVLTNALFVDPVPNTTQIMSNYGILNRSNNKYFGWSGSSWSTSGDSVTASSFSTIGGATYGTNSVYIPIENSADAITIGSTGINVGSFVQITPDSIELDSNLGAIYFGNRAWKISYDLAENALSFSKLVNGDYVCKLFLD